MAIMVLGCAMLGTVAMGMMYDPEVINASQESFNSYAANGGYWAFQRLGEYYHVGNLFLILYAMCNMISQFAILILSIDAPLRMLLDNEKTNEGIVIKSHAGQKYTSDALSIALFKMICERAGVPVQFFANRSDMNGGSTLGNIAMSQVSVNTVDIGLAQLAMHSSYETAGIKDAAYLIRAAEVFYNSHICETDAGVYEIEK